MFGFCISMQQQKEHILDQRLVIFLVGNGSFWHTLQPYISASICQRFPEFKSSVVTLQNHRQSPWNQGTYRFYSECEKNGCWHAVLGCSDMFRVILPLGMTVHYCRSSYRRETCILFLGVAVFTWWVEHENICKSFVLRPMSVTPKVCPSITLQQVSCFIQETQHIFITSCA